MTQTERTDRMIAAGPQHATNFSDLLVHMRIMEAHARDLAGKLDAIMRIYEADTRQKLPIDSPLVP